MHTHLFFQLQPKQPRGAPASRPAAASCRHAQACRSRVVPGASSKESQFTPTVVLPGPVHLLVDTQVKKDEAFAIKACRVEDMGGMRAPHPTIKMASSTLNYIYYI